MKADLSQKDVLNPLETIDLFVLSRRKFYDLLKHNEGLKFLAKYGTRNMIIQTEFEKYLQDIQNYEGGVRMATRRDSKHRVLRRGESIRQDGRYQFKYHVNGKAHFVYSWRLEPTDKLPVGRKPCLSLRELEKQIGYDLDNRLDPVGKNITVNELVDRYLATKTGVKYNTQMNYNFVKNILKAHPFGDTKISKVKTSDAKLFLIKLQQEDGRGYSSVKTIRGVLRPAFQMAVDDDVLNKNPFGFQLAGVVVNDSVTREAITKEQMNKFLKFVHDDNVYCKY